MTSTIKDTVRFFKLLYPNNSELHFGYMRRNPNDREAKAAFVTGNHHDQTFKTGGAAFALRSRMRVAIAKSEDLDILFAPMPMNGVRNSANALPGYVVYGDADHGLTPEVKAQLIELDAVLVRSGGTTPNGPKYHIYILLDRPTDPVRIEQMNKALKALINGDKFDRSAFLRVPGTINHKYGHLPTVTVERWATTRIHPDRLWEALDADNHPLDKVATSGELADVLKTVEAVNVKAKEYWPMRRTVNNLNQTFVAGRGGSRYKAATAIANEAAKRGFGVEVAIAFALTCEPLVDKAEEEDGYRIDKDIMRQYNKVADSLPATIPDVDTSSSIDTDSVIEVVVPKTQQHTGEGPNPHSTSENGVRHFIDMALYTSGDFKPLEPEFFNVDGMFSILYPGMTHCVFGDSGSGKTWMVLAFIAAELKAGRRVKYIDFENGAMTIGNRLRNILGVPAELLTPDHFKYMAFNEKPEKDSDDIAIEAQEAYDLVIIDGVDASLAMWEVEGNSTVEIRRWYNDFPQRFADEGSTVLSIDHTTKKASKDIPKPKDQQPGGSAAKLSVLTGAAFYVHPRNDEELVPGRRGVVEVFVTRKDKDGYLKAKSTKERGHLFDFIIDTVDGETVVGFEAAMMDDDAVKRSDPQASLTDNQKAIMFAVNKDPGKHTKTGLSKPVHEGGLGANKSGVLADVTWLVENHFLHVEGYKLYPVLASSTPGGSSKKPAPQPKPKGEPPVRLREGRWELDFTNVDKEDTKHDKGKGNRECHACRDSKPYPENFAQADDEGYTEGFNLCMSCVTDPIARHQLESGPEWARKTRESIERKRRERNRRQG